MRLALIGVGLVGGSAAAAFRASGAAQTVVGFDQDAAVAPRARVLGVIDHAAASVAEAVNAADLVLLAVPVGAMPAVLAEVAAHARPDAIVTDVGSTKRSVIEAARSALAGTPVALSRFVPAHPIAGGELPGVEYASATLFQGKRLITTPLVDTDPAALAAVESLWRAAGAEVIRMDADEHDRIFAAVSHLPHLLSFALVAKIAADADGARKLGFAGAGFRDFTRIAASSPVMWRDVALANRAALSEELRGYRAVLERLQRAVDAGDGEQLAALFEVASRTRRGSLPAATTVGDADA